MLSTFTNYLLLAFSVSALIAPVLINVLYRLNVVVRHKLMANKMNEEFIKLHAHKSGTPRSGGLIISIPVLLLTLIFIPQSNIRDIFMIGWSAFALYGLADDLLVSWKKMNDKFRLFQETFVWRVGKLALLVLITTGLVVLFKSQLGLTSISIFNFFAIELTPIAIPVVALAIVLAIYGVEITDGLDGLVAGQFLIGLITYAVIASVTGFTQFLPFLALIFGATVVYLYFNINPARVFMGGSGTMPVAFALIMFALLTHTAGILLIMGTVFWIELASSFIQIVAIRFFKKKVFRIAPIHHHFEAIGWPEAKVVQRFWLAAAAAAVFALWILATMRGL